MQASLAVNRRMVALLSTDATTLAPAADANIIALVVASFIPGPDTVVGDLTLADPAYLAPIAGQVGSQLIGYDPTTGEAVITIKEPVDGWLWQLASTPPDAITVYGYALLNDAGTVLLGSALLPTPVAMTVLGDYLDIGNATFRCPFAPLY